MKTIDTGEVRECSICNQYHHEGHPMIHARENRQNFIKKINENYSKEKRAKAAKKGWDKIKNKTVHNSD